MLAILLHLPNPPSADTLFWLELLGTKSFLQYLFRMWSNCLPVSSPRVLALLLVTAVLKSVSTAPWTKSFSHLSGNTKKPGAGCKWPQEQAPWEKKCLALQCCGLAHDLRLSLIFGIFPCVDISMYSQEETVCGYMGKLLCSACALNIRLCHPISHLAYLIITVSHSTVLCCPHPHPHRAIQKK